MLPVITASLASLRAHANGSRLSKSLMSPRLARASATRKSSESSSLSDSTTWAGSFCSRAPARLLKAPRRLPALLLLLPPRPSTTSICDTSGFRRRARALNSFRTRSLASSASIASIISKSGRTGASSMARGAGRVFAADFKDSDQASSEPHVKAKNSRSASLLSARVAARSWHEAHHGAFSSALGWPRCRVAARDAICQASDAISALLALALISFALLASLTATGSGVSCKCSGASSVASAAPSRQTCHCMPSVWRF
mmetsp:Transcript_34728/g.77892  ORF Transcript_34728/g.77892 Transcript_34728/m.77892 type:complete len:258 (+) Transcript_34728:482-1255(+)